MVNRMDKYNDSNIDDIPKRSDKNKKLYEQVYNGYDEFENLVVPSNAKEIDLSTLKREISSRDEYKRIKDYGDITNNKVIRKEIIQEEQKKENEIYDINELIKNAVKDTNKVEEITPEKEDYLKKLRLDNINMDEEINFEENMDEEELMKTANLSLEILSDLKGDNENTIISPVEKDEEIEEDSQFYSDQYQFNQEDFDVNDEPDLEDNRKADWKIFLKIFLCIFGILLIGFVVFLLV